MGVTRGVADGMDCRIFYNPLAVLGKRAGPMVALAVAAALCASAWWGSVHQSRSFLIYAFSGEVSLPLIIAQTLVSWICPALVLFITAAVFGGESGVRNYVAAVGVSRVPFIIGSFLLSSHTGIGRIVRAAARGAVSPEMHTRALFAAACLILLVLWATTMMFFGWKEASGIRGGRAIIPFAMGVVLAEWAGRYLLSLIIYWG